MSVTISLDQELAELLSGLAERSSSSQDEVLKNAIIAYDDYDKWVRGQIEAGLKEAKAGDLIPNEVVEQEMRELLNGLKSTNPAYASSMDISR